MGGGGGFVSAECDRERREKPFPAIFSFALVVPPEKRPKSLDALQTGILVSCDHSASFGF